MISFRQKGDFLKATKYLERLREFAILDVLDKYGREGVAALSSATPIESGRTASSWYYKINNGPGFAAIEFHNSNIEDGVPIAVIIQYGHGTGTGGYVEGRDYINPAIQPVFDRIVEDVRKEVIKL